ERAHLSTRAGSIHIRIYAYSQDTPQPKGLLPRIICSAAISDIEMKEEINEEDAVYVARWDTHGYATVDQLKDMTLIIDAREATDKKKAAATHGAFHSAVTRQIGVVSRGCCHWMSFFIDLSSSDATCTLFDSMQSNASYDALERTVQASIISQLGQSQISFERWTQCKQQDGHSCGIWSLFFLEFILTEHPWADS
ncbi:Ulp1 protease family C-terminal catalytic domain-containing protein, partial [Phytophthora infestans]